MNLRNQILRKINPKPTVPKKYDGKGTRARLNTAADKMFFGRNNYKINLI